MAYEQKDNSGSLFKNEKREKDTHAHARGSALIDGVAYFVDAWTNTDKNGNKYQSLKFKRKDQQVAQQAGGWNNAPPPRDFDDELPPF
jgi:hypothetical protein